MLTTSVRLLERLRLPGDAQAWERFVRLYTPLLHCWAGRLGLADADAADLVQDVFVILVQKLPQFIYDPQQSFRGWLRTILMNRWRQRQRKQAGKGVQGQAALAAAADSDPLEEFQEAEYRRHLVGRALLLMQSDFETTTWRACWETVGHGRPVPEVAAELGLTITAVYLARSRVLRRLRQELQGLL
jgi:RNA polymerase sigma-70 factor, ECF subfamily